MVKMKNIDIQTFLEKAEFCKGLFPDHWRKSHTRKYKTAERFTQRYLRTHDVKHPMKYTLS